jgi:hypothetical protein
MLKKSVFTIEDYPKAYIGYTSPMKWKCWDMPYFELEEAKRVAEGFNECAEHPMEYDPIYDQFYAWDAGNEDYDFVKGEDFLTEDGIKHLYGIGAGSWLWDGITESKCQCLAASIEDFIYEYDTYHYQDECLDRMKIVESIQTQLKEWSIFQQIHEIWNGDELTSDEVFEKLHKILKI